MTVKQAWEKLDNIVKAGKGNLELVIPFFGGRLSVVKFKYEEFETDLGKGEYEAKRNVLVLPESVFQNRSI